MPSRRQRRTRRKARKGNGVLTVTNSTVVEPQSKSVFKYDSLEMRADRVYEMVSVRCECAVTGTPTGVQLRGYSGLEKETIVCLSPQTLLTPGTVRSVSVQWPTGHYFGEKTADFPVFAVFNPCFAMKNPGGAISVLCHIRYKELPDIDDRICMKVPPFTVALPSLSLSSVASISSESCDQPSKRQRDES